MKQNKKLSNTLRETQLFYLKILYNDSFFWQLIHKGHSMEKSELEVLVGMIN